MLALASDAEEQQAGDWPEDVIRGDDQEFLPSIERQAERDREEQAGWKIRIGAAVGHQKPACARPGRDREPQVYSIPIGPLEIVAGEPCDPPVQEGGPDQAQEEKDDDED
jgi:hypothetical protein